MGTPIDYLLPDLSGRGSRYSHRPGRKGILHLEGSFKCKTCQAYVHNLPVLSGVHNRNHCPYCLWSRHLDLYHAGDRLSACKAGMQPIGLTVKRGRDKYGVERHGELMLVHRCSECKALSINRIAADDTVDCLVDVLHISSELDVDALYQIENAGIRLLRSADSKLVESRLFGTLEH